MKQDDAPGPRIDAAKNAIHTLVSGLPDDAALGLIAYGTATGSSDAEKVAGCRDIKTVVPLGPLDRNAFAAGIDGLSASGYTPIMLRFNKPPPHSPPMVSARSSSLRRGGHLLDRTSV